MNVNSHMQVGTWGNYDQPRWAERLDSANNFVIESTGLSKEKLFEVLHLLDNYNIIR